MACQKLTLDLILNVAEIKYQQQMAKIKVSISNGEITIEFQDTEDLEDQLEKIDLDKIDSMLERKKQSTSDAKDQSTDANNTYKKAEHLGTVNLLRISEGGEDAVKLAVFLSASGLTRDEIKKITGVTILSS